MRECTKIEFVSIRVGGDLTRILTYKSSTFLPHDLNLSSDYMQEREALLRSRESIMRGRQMQFSRVFYSCVSKQDVHQLLRFNYPTIKTRLT